METETQQISDSNKKNITTGCWGCLILLAMIVIIMIILISGNSKETDEMDKSNEAWVCAQMKIKEMLKSPKSAEFEFGGATKSTKAIGNEKYEIKSYVDAENSFGAKIRSNFECTVTYETKSNTCESYCKFTE